jgi:hypothetical protein
MIALKKSSSELEKVFVEWSLLSTFHCYPKIFQYENKIAKVIWSLIFILFSAATSFLVATSFNDFFEYRVVSTIRLVDERPILFPAVTICDNNAFNTVQAQHLMDSLWSDYFSDINKTSSEMRSFIEFTKAYAMSHRLTENEKKQLGNTINARTIHSCRFSGRECNFESDFSWYYDFNYGNCAQFNMGKMSRPIKAAYLEGLFFGLTLLIGPLMNEKRKYAVASSKGLKVFVHNQSFAPTSSEAISIKTGEETNIAIKKSFFHNYPMPYSLCQDLTYFHSLLYDYITKNLSMVYKQKNCLYLYGQLRIINTCKCYHPRQPAILASIPPCLNRTQLECVYKEDSVLNEEKLREAKSECPLECNTVSYDLTVSSLEYPSGETYEEFGENSLNFSMFKENYLALNVYFVSTQYTYVAETPKMSLLDLVSNVGGGDWHISRL